MNLGPCWAEISLPQLKENLNIIRRHVALRVPASTLAQHIERKTNRQGDPEQAERVGAERKVLAVVKADAYGHGAVPVARALEEAGVDFLGVAAVGEAVELREAGIKAPILVLTGFFPGEGKILVEHNITPGITEPDQIERLEQAAGAAGRKVRCHVKVDTGMGRLGIAGEAVTSVAERLAGNPHLEVEGLYTHFAASEDFTSEQTQQQVERFEKARAEFAAHGLEPPLIHLANTGALAGRPETWGTMVRPGSILYGFISFFKFPEGQDRTAEIHAALPVRPVLTLKARVYMVRDYPPNAALGYGARFVTKRPSRIAVLPVGYGHGWRRGLSNNCRIILRGEFAPMVGTIGMDITLADVTDVPGAEDGDEVILIGTNGKVSIPPTEPARALGTVASEVLSGLTKRIPRVYCE